MGLIPSNTAYSVRLALAALGRTARMFAIRATQRPFSAGGPFYLAFKGEAGSFSAPLPKSRVWGRWGGICGSPATRLGAFRPRPEEGWQEIGLCLPRMWE